MIGAAIGEFQVRAVLTLFYFTIALPFGLVNRLLRDPLHARRPPAESAWTPRPPDEPSLVRARQQF